MQLLIFPEMKKLCSRAFLILLFLLCLLAPLLTVLGPWQQPLREERKLYLMLEEHGASAALEEAGLPEKTTFEFRQNYENRRTFAEYLKKKSRQLQAKREMASFKSDYQTKLQLIEARYLKQLESKDFSMQEDSGWRRLLDTPLLLMAQFLCGSALLERLFLQERNLGLDHLINTFPFGRQGLFFRRILLFTLCFGAVSIFLYGFFVLLLLRETSFPELPAQLLSGYRDILYPFSAAELFFLQTSLTFMAMMALFFFLLYLFLRFEGISFPILVSVSALSIGALLYRLILPHSHFALFRYINPAIAFFIPQELQRTFFIPVFGYPFSNFQMLTAMLLFMCVTALFLALFASSREPLHVERRWKKGHLRVWRLGQADIHLVWIRRAMLGCLLFLILFLGQDAMRFRRVENPQEMLLAPFYEQYGGPLDAEVLTAMEERAENARIQIQKISELRAELRDLQEEQSDQDAEKSSSIENPRIEAVLDEIRGLEQADPEAHNFLAFYERIGENISQGARYLSRSDGHKLLWGVRNRFYPEQRYVFGALFVLILLCGAYAPEHEGETAELLRSMPEGREHLLGVRVLQLSLAVFSFSLVIHLLQLGKLARFYAMNGWTADLRSLLAVPSDLPLWLYVLLEFLITFAFFFCSGLFFYGILIWGGRLRCLAIGTVYFTLIWLIAQLGFEPYSFLWLFSANAFGDPIRLVLLLLAAAVPGVWGVFYLNHYWNMNHA